MVFFRSRDKQRNPRPHQNLHNRPAYGVPGPKDKTNHQNANFPATSQRSEPSIPYQHQPSKPPITSSHINQTFYGNGIIADIEDSFDAKYNQFGSPLWSWIDHTTQSADDGTVVDRVKEVFFFADQFVNNFYADQTCEHDISERALERVSCSSLYSTTQLRSQLSKADYHTIIIKHILVSLLLDLIAFDSASGKGSLLPREFQNYNIIAETQTRSSASSNDTPNLQPALSSYRVLSAYIRSHTQRDNQFLRERQSVIEGVVRALERAFRFWTLDDRTRDDRQAALRQLCGKAGDLGIFLFSQPSVFLFDWEMAQFDQSDRLVPIWPRLLKIYDAEARRRETADLLITMRYETILSDVPQEQKPVKAVNSAMRGPHQSVRVSNKDDIRSNGISNSAPITGPEIYHKTSAHDVHQPYDNHNNEVVSPLASDDELSNRSWALDDEVSVSPEMNSSTGVRNDAIAHQTATQSQSCVTYPTVEYSQAVTSDLRATMKPFHAAAIGNGAPMPQWDTPTSQSHPLQYHVIDQSTRTYAGDYSRNSNNRMGNEQSLNTDNGSNEPWQTSIAQRRYRQPDQQSHPRPRLILDGGPPLTHSARMIDEQRGRTMYSGYENTTQQPSHHSDIAMTAAPTTSKHPIRASERFQNNTNSSNTNNFSYSTQEQIYLPPPPHQPANGQQQESPSSLSKLVHGRPQTSNQLQTPTPPHQHQQQDQHQHQHQEQPRQRERGRGRDRDRDKYPPNAYTGIGIENGVDTPNDQSDIGYSNMIERGDNRRDDRGRERDSSVNRPRKRSSSLASIRNFLRV